MKSRFDPMTVAAMAVAVVSISATAPLTAAATASPLAMAFWRNALGFAVLGPVLLLLRRRQVVRVARRERALLRREQWRPLAVSALAATALALHFAAFMTSTRLTTVAMSTALIATQPVWQALIAAGQGARFSRRTWTGLIVAVVGAAAAAGLDIKSGGTALMGDLLALAGAVAGAGYTALSHKARADMGTTMYSTVCSLVCGLELFVICRLAGIHLTGFDTSTNLSLLGLLVLPQLLGLGAMNFALGRTSATTMSVLLLLETPVAALAAWWFMGQSVEAAAVPGLLLTMVGVTIAVTSSEAERKPAPHDGRLPQAASYQGHSTALPPPPASTWGPAFKQPEPGVHSPVLIPPWPISPPAPGRSTTRDPRVAWAGLGDSSTITLSYHGAGVFDTLPMVRRREQDTPADTDTRRIRT
ncbi:DMT family transporter [Streptomyces sp. NPDC001928]|uniref:DMT family transporter n=1 Tax=Streptomyces sp. NPDC001928 TaxID=3154404 RepID=UPI00332324D1